MIIIEVRPFFELLIEEAAIINNHSIEHPIKLFFVSPVTSFDLPIELGPSLLYIHVIDSLVQDVPINSKMKIIPKSN